jgi:uncharacterized protein DUF6515
MKAIKIYLPILFILAILSCFSANAQHIKVNRARVVRGPVTIVKIRPHVSRNAHVHYAHMPRWGSVVTVLPAGYLTYNTFYYHSGVFYTKRNNGFVVVHPARGIRITTLPLGYRTIYIGPHTYYYYYGTFYTKVVNHDEYEIIDAPEGAVVDALPEGYEVKTIHDNEYYVLDGVYYGEVDTNDIDGGVGYRVVKM